MSTLATNHQAEVKVRKTSTKEFKTQAVGLARRPGIKFRQAATDLGINESRLRFLAQSAELDGPEDFRAHGVRTEIEARLAALERENRILREERGFGKSLEFYVKERR